MGWTITPLGVALTGLTIGIDKTVPTTTSAQQAAKTGLYAAGGGVLGFGVLCFVLGAVLRSPATWQYRVSGEVVRRSRAIPPPSPPPEPRDPFAPRCSSDDEGCAPAPAPPTAATSTTTPAPVVAPTAPASSASPGPPAAAPKAGVPQAPAPPPPPRKKRTLD